MKKLIFAACFAFAVTAAGCGQTEDLTSGLAIPPAEDVSIFEDVPSVPTDIVPHGDAIADIKLPEEVSADSIEVPEHSYVVVIADPHITVDDDENADETHRGRRRKVYGRN